MKRRTCIAAATCAALAGAIIASAVVIVAGRRADDAAVDEIDCAFGRIEQSLNAGGADGKAVFWDDDSAVSIDISAFE